MLLVCLHTRLDGTSVEHILGICVKTRLPWLFMRAGGGGWAHWGWVRLVLLLEGSLEYHMHVMREINLVIYIRRLFTSTVFVNLKYFFFFKQDLFFFPCAQPILSYHHIYFYHGFRKKKWTQGKTYKNVGRLWI